MPRYSKLEHSGVTHHLQAAQHFDSLRPVQDDEIRHALLTLEASTSAIEKQESNLRAQHDALLTFQRTRLHAETQARRTAIQKHQKRQQALQRLRLAVSTPRDGSTRAKQSTSMTSS